MFAIINKKLRTAVSRRSALVVGLLFASTLLLLAATDGRAKAASTITVNSTADTAADDGVCTLREAIIAANTDTASGGTTGECAAGSGADTIVFNITGSGTHVISPTTALPAISSQVTIDGYSQPGSAANGSDMSSVINGQIRIAIDGAGLATDTGGLNISGAGTTVSGIAIYGFDVSAGGTDHGDIEINANNVSISGVYAGVQADGLTTAVSSTNEVGVTVLSGSNVVIGGIDAADRNIIGTIGDAYGLNIAANGTVVEGNYVNVGKDGTTDLDGTGGIQIAGANNVIVGGNTAAKRNVVSGAQLINILNYGSDNNVFQGNYIGTDAFGNVNSSITNGPRPGITNSYLQRGVGIALTASHLSLVGGVNPGEGNLIAGVHGIGIALERMKVPAYSMDLIPDKNSILGNSIYDVGIANYPPMGNNNSGIDMIGDTLDASFSNSTYDSIGPNANDAGDVDDGANGQMNKPVVKSAVQTGDKLTIVYDLDAADSPSNSYRVEFFANDSTDIFGIPFAKTLLGSATVAPGNNHSVTFTTSTSRVGSIIGATTTAVDATTDSDFGSTSEIGGGTRVVASSEGSSLADTGDDLSAYVATTTVLLITSAGALAVALRNRKVVYISKQK